jgi:hypothetical protein
MIVTIIKIILFGVIGVALLLSIPEVSLPLLSALDSVIDTNLVLVMQAVYDTIPIDLISLFIMQLSTIALIIIIRATIGNRKG